MHTTLIIPFNNEKYNSKVSAIYSKASEYIDKVNK